MNRCTFSCIAGRLSRCSRRTAFRSCKLLLLHLGVDRLLGSAGSVLPMFGDRLLLLRLRCFVVLKVAREFQVLYYTERRC